MKTRVNSIVLLIVCMVFCFNAKMFAFLANRKDIDFRDFLRKYWPHDNIRIIVFINSWQQIIKSYLTYLINIVNVRPVKKGWFCNLWQNHPFLLLINRLTRLGTNKYIYPSMLPDTVKNWKDNRIDFKLKTYKYETYIHQINTLPATHHDKKMPNTKLRIQLLF